MLLVFSFIKKINQMSEIFVNVNFGNVHLCWKAKKQGGKMLIHCTCIYLGYTLRHNTCSTDKNRYLVTGLLLHWTAAFPSWQSILLGTINVTGAGLKWFDRVVYCIYSPVQAFSDPHTFHSLNFKVSNLQCVKIF